MLLIVYSLHKQVFVMLEHPRNVSNLHIMKCVSHTIHYYFSGESEGEVK
jgi:hypothetical protein